MRKEKYLSLYTAVYSRRGTIKFLSVLSEVITYLTVAAYGLFIGFCAVDNLPLCLSFLAVTATPFVAITLMRRAINAPRPYEVFECDALSSLKEKGKSGSSFPSRHAASSFIIGSALCFTAPAAGVVILALGVLLCVCRVLLGRHFIRDVVVGAVIGGISGTLGMLIVGIFLR